MGPGNDAPHQQTPAFGAPMNPLMAVAELTGTLMSMLDPTAVLQATNAELAKVLPYFTAIVWLFDQESEEIYVASSAGLSEDEQKVRVKRNVGLLGTVMNSGEAINVLDTLEEPRFVQQFTKNLTRSVMLAPIKIDGKPIGILTVGNLRPRTYTHDDFQLLIACANASSIAVKNAQLYAAQKEETEIRDSLLKVSEEIRSLARLEDLLKRIAELSAVLAGTDKDLILLADEKETEICFAQSHGFSPADLNEIQGKRIAGDQAAEMLKVCRDLGRTRFFESIANSPFGLLGIEHLIPESSLACLPLVSKGRAMGAIILIFPGHSRKFSDRELALLTGLGDQAAVAIENTMLYQEAMERRREAQENTARLRAILHSMAEGVIVYDKDMHIQITNPAIARVFRAERVSVRNLGMLDALEPFEPHFADFPAILRRIEASHAEPEKPFEMEWVLKDPPLVMKRVWSPVYDSQGNYIGGVAVFHNMTAEREAQSARDEFISIVSHEVRNPLSLIKGLAQTMLRRRRQDEPTREHEELRVIVEQADRIARLVNDLLDVSRIERRVLSLQPQAIRLPSIIRDLVKKLAPTLSQHSVILSLPDIFPEGQWDKDRLTQVLTNLIDNAAKYTPDGGEIRISCEIVNGEALVSVADTGMGIAEESISRVFDRFYRIPQTNRPRSIKPGSEGGVGLGLYVTRGIVRAHGGQIWVESKPNEGTRFCFSLPLEPAGQGDQESGSEKRE